MGAAMDRHKLKRILVHGDSSGNAVLATNIISELAKGAGGALQAKQSADAQAKLAAAAAAAGKAGAPGAGGGKAGAHGGSGMPSWVLPVGVGAGILGAGYLLFRMMGKKHRR